MTIIVTEGLNGCILIGSKDRRFSETWGSVYRCRPERLYQEMGNLASWCNNELKEECLFEVV